MAFELPALPYAYDALGPYMSKETLECWSYCSECSMGCTAEQLTAPRTVLIEILYRLFAPGKVWVIAQTCLPVGLNIKFHPYGQQSLHGWMDGWMAGIVL